MALYQREGYADIAPFGEYVNSPLSVCMAKDIYDRQNNAGLAARACILPSATSSLDSHVR